MKKREKPDYDIDFVLLWVDGSDPEWQKQKKEYSHDSMDDDRPQRYRDLGFLRYWFRGVELYAPWVRNIYLVTWGHLPEWLNTDHPKLHIVKHSDYMPAEYLPTFNSHALELNLFRIKGLSEHFVYFNDDAFLIDHTKPTDFFKNGKPVDMLALQPDVANETFPLMSYIYINNALFISRHFNKRSQMKRFKSKFFHIGYPPLHFGYNLIETAFPRYTGFYTVHGPSPILKKTCETLWSLEGERLDEVSRHKFRNWCDVSQYIIREWQKQSGEFVPENLHRKFRFFDVGVDTEKAVHFIRKQKRRMICLNDSDKEIDFEAVKKILSQALSEIMPEPSSFEK